MVKALRYWSDGPGIDSRCCTGDFFRGSFRQNHVPWGRLSLWKWVPGISRGVKAAGAFGWRPTTLVVLNVEMIWGLTLPGTARATSACRGTSLLYFTLFIKTKIMLVFLWFGPLILWLRKISNTAEISWCAGCAGYRVAEFSRINNRFLFMKSITVLIKVRDCA